MAPKRAGLLLEFSKEHAVLVAARILVASKVGKIAVYSPHPIAELDAILPVCHRRFTAGVLASAVTGLFGAYTLQYFTILDYPLDIGGRPLNSIPSFIPITFELTILATALAIVIGFMLSLRLPRLHNPLFETRAFLRASADRYFIHVEPLDQTLSREEVLSSLPGNGMEGVYEI